LHERQRLPGSDPGRGYVMVMSARATLATLSLCAVLACKENIPRPPDSIDDGGASTPTDVSSVDGPGSPPDLVDATPVSTCGAAPGGGTRRGTPTVAPPGLCVPGGRRR